MKIKNSLNWGFISECKIKNIQVFGFTLDMKPNTYSKRSRKQFVCITDVQPLSSTMIIS